jgi:hypothetical protein
MRCRSCGSRTRVVHTERRLDGNHRWLRCLSCDALTRTLETYFQNHKRGPEPGVPRPGARACGSRNAASVLSEDDVIRLRELSAKGIPNYRLAAEYGIAPATVSRIINRKVWTHI